MEKQINQQMNETWAVKACVFCFDENIGNFSGKS